MSTLYFIFGLVCILPMQVCGKSYDKQCEIRYDNAGAVTADCSGRELTSFSTWLMIKQVSDDVTKDRGIQVLDLSNNLLEKVDWQSLPDSLQELYLSNNNIANLFVNKGGPNTSWSLSTVSLPELRVLVVSNNRLTALDQFRFSDISAPLEVLDLSRNHLQIIENNTFHGLSNLTYLDLSYNQITALQPGALSGLWSLERLDLNNNELEDSPTALPPGVFHDVSTTLTTLNLHGNWMGTCGKYPSAAFGDLRALEKLSIDFFPTKQKSSYFGPGFSLLGRLKNLHLEESRYEGLHHLSNKTFAFFANTSLQSLVIDRSVLHWVHACVFCPLHNLKYLSFNDMHNVIVKLEDVLATFHTFAARPNEEFQSIILLGFVGHTGTGTGIHLTGQAMRFVRKMCLRELVLSSNYIVALTRDALGEKGDRLLECLQRLDLSDNLLIYAEVSFYFTLSFFQQLRSLEIQLQRVFNLKMAMRMFSLRQVITDDDKFDANMSFSFPPAIEFLNASGFSYLLGDFPSFVKLAGTQKLITVDASFNRIINCSPVLGLENMQNLNLSGSICHFISLQTFDYYPRLRTLTLQRMNFSPLFLAHNGTRLFRKLSSLEILDLSFNEIDILPPNMLMQHMSLRQLILLGNNLENLQVDVSGLTNLTFLDLSNNRFSTLSSAERTMLDRLAARQQEPLRLHLQDNPLLCTCSTLDFVRWLGDTRVVLDREGDYPCLTDSGQLSSTRTVGREWLHAWRGCVGPTVLWAAVAGMLVLLSLMGAVWGLVKNITRLRFFYTVMRMIKMPKRADFHRDAYVAYCDADTDFVCGRLKRRLQDHRGVRLLIKDLPVDAAETRFYQLPGDNVALKMLEHIDLCWKVILVLTPALTRDSMVGFMTRAVLQSITDRMPHRVLLLCVGVREVPEVMSLKALLEAVPEHQVFFLPQPGEHSHSVWDEIAQLILK